MFSTSVLGEKMKNKKVIVAGVLLSEACALSKNHPLSKALSPLSELGEFGGESATHARTQHVISSLSESFVFSRAKRAQLV